MRNVGAHDILLGDFNTGSSNVHWSSWLAKVGFTEHPNL